MKKTLFSLALSTACLFATSTQAQFFVRGGGGYGFSANNDAVGTSVTKDENGATTNIKNLYGTTSQGPTARIAPGYMINKHFGVELQFYYMSGMFYTIGEEISPTVTNVTEERSVQGRAVPAIIVDAGMETISPYARFGVLVPFTGKTTRTTLVTTETTVNDYVLEAFGAFSVGFESAVGVNYNINSRLSVHGEVYYSGLRIKSDRGQVVKNEQRDMEGNVLIDYLDGAGTSSTEINFVDELTVDNNTLQIPEAAANFNFDEPIDVLTIRSNYNSVGFNVGVKYAFGE